MEFNIPPFSCKNLLGIKKNPEFLQVENTATHVIADIERELYEKGLLIDCTKSLIPTNCFYYK